MLTLWWRIVVMRTRADWQYRASFVVFFVSQLLITFADFVVILIIFERVPALGGWSVAEVALVYGLSGVAFNLGDIFVSEVEMSGAHIREGTFDQFLLRPIPALLHLCAREFAFRRVGKLFQSGGVLVVAALAAPIDWTPALVGFTVVSILAGTAIFSGLWVVTSSLAFWTETTQEVANAFTYGGNYFTSYPVHIFSEWLRRIMAFVLPLAFVAYLPALVLLDRDDPLGLPEWLRFASPAVAAVVVALSSVVWRTAIRRYRSTGS